MVGVPGIAGSGHLSGFPRLGAQPAVPVIRALTRISVAGFIGVKAFQSAINMAIYKHEDYGRHTRSGLSAAKEPCSQRRQFGKGTDPARGSADIEGSAPFEAKKGEAPDHPIRSAGDTQSRQ